MGPPIQWLMDLRVVYPNLEALPSSSQSTALREQTYQKDGKTWWPHKKKKDWLPTVAAVRIPLAHISQGSKPDRSLSSSRKQASSIHLQPRIKITRRVLYASTPSKGGKHQTILGEYHIIWYLMYETDGKAGMCTGRNFRNARSSQLP